MKDIVVILDNGHGKDTPGKCAPDKSLYEWQWCREIASMLCFRLRMMNIDTIMLVPEDNDVSLKERVRRVNTIHHDAKIAGRECLLISIHINAAGAQGKWMNANGWSVWVSNNASDKSKKFAQIAYEQALSFNLKGNRSVPKEHYWSSNFYILKNTSCPAVLTENMFQDNKEDVAFLKSIDGKQKIVELHLNAVKKYIEIR